MLFDMLESVKSADTPSPWFEGLELRLWSHHFEGGGARTSNIEGPDQLPGLGFVSMLSLTCPSLPRVLRLHPPACQGWFYREWEAGVQKCFRVQGSECEYLFCRRVYRTTTLQKRCCSLTCPSLPRVLRPHLPGCRGWGLGCGRRARIEDSWTLQSISG